MAERIALVDLEERFAGDKDKKELDKLLRELDGYIVETKKALDGGLPPEEFRNVAKYHAALEQARDTAIRVWALNVKV
jgi:hypothetical protein